MCLGWGAGRGSNKPSWRILTTFSSSIMLRAFMTEVLHVHINNVGHENNSHQLRDAFTMHCPSGGRLKIKISDLCSVAIFDRLFDQYYI